MFKTKLQEICHKHSWNFPKYTTVKDGPDHSPRFTSTVVVNGVSFESPKYILIRSSKEAQNQAAKLAFDHFTDPKTILPHIPNSHSAQNNPVPMSSVMLNLYKNRLRLYAEKKNITLPEYSCESDGPPHACRFKSRVTIGGRTYETLQFFATLKDAEHAVAKVAFESLPCDDIPEDERLYKNILQELTQKEGFLFPTYDTIKSGPSHMPTFVSTVEIGDQTFRGWEAKSKKQAEMHAAKVAYTSLTERRASQNKASEISSNVQAIVANKLQPNITKSNLISCQEQAENDKGRASLNNASEISSNVQAMVADKLQPNITKSHLISCEEQAENDKGRASLNNASEISSNVQAIVADKLQPNITKSHLISCEEQAENDKGRASLNNASEISSNVQAIVADKLQPNITKSHLISCEEQAENDKGRASLNNASEISSNVQAIVADKLQPNITKSHLISCEEQAENDKGRASLNNASEISSNVQAIVADKLQPNITKSHLISCEEQAENDKGRASLNNASEISSNVQAIVADKLQPNITKSHLISCEEQAENDKGRASLNNASEILSNVQAIVADKLQPNITKSHLISCEEQAENDKGMANQNPIVLSPGGHVEEKVEVSSSCLQSIATDDLQQNIRTKAKLVSRKEEDTEDKDINPKRFKCSSSSEAGYALLQDPFSTPSEDSANSLTGDVTLPRSENC